MAMQIEVVRHAGKVGFRPEFAIGKIFAFVTFSPPLPACDFANRLRVEYLCWQLMSDSAVFVQPAHTPEAAVAKGVAFKDWSLVCAALGQGRQSLILRKGGIAEGRAGFQFKHEAFFLFPTQYHQQAKRVRPEILPTIKPVPPPPAGVVEIRYFFAMEWAVWLDEWNVVARLEPFHIWREDVIRERFAYDEQRGLQCAFGRVYRLYPAWTLPDRPAFGGCRSWITLPGDPPAAALEPVLTDAEHNRLADQVRTALGPECAAIFHP